MINKTKWNILLATACLLLSMIAKAQFDVPAIFSNNMVLQSLRPVPIYGRGVPGERITVTFKGKTFTTHAGNDSSWLVWLDTYAAGGPYEMSIAGDVEEKIITNILIGEVWLASGQSNMEFGIQKESHGVEAIAKATDTLIRFFYVPMASSLTRQKDIAPVPAGSLNGKWIVCSPEVMAAKWAWNGFSAAGYYFAQQIRSATGRPVGMIGSYKGGTRAEVWLSEEGKYFHAMIAPLIPYAIKGVIWYQGESNGDRLTDALEYKTLFPRMIKDWRRQWNQGDFPFLFVQLTSHRPAAKTPSEGNWPWVREAQQKTLSLRNTGMAVTTDIGDAKDIHPTNKLDVGLRLALAARSVAYHQKLTYAGPMYQSMQVKGKEIHIRFTHTSEGLAVKSDIKNSVLPQLKGFGIAAEDGRFVWANARIAGNEVIVYSDEIKKPVAVRYNWADNPPGNLINKDGLPAAPFRTDNWPPPIK